MSTSARSTLGRNGNKRGAGSALSGSGSQHWQGRGKASKNVASRWQPASDSAQKPGLRHEAHRANRCGLRPRGPICAYTHAQAGFTLIEFIVALVIIGIAGAALLSAFITPLANSADPQLIAQSRAIATSYMDEILLRDFGAGACVGASRPTWQTIWCYDGLDEPPTDQFGNPIGALSDYNVGVNVAGDSTTATIVVNVTHTSGTANLTMESRRGNY